MLRNQPSAQPTRKLQFSGGVGVVVWFIILIASSQGIELPPEVVAGLTTVLSFGAGYLVKERA